MRRPPNLQVISRPEVRGPSATRVFVDNHTGRGIAVSTAGRFVCHSHYKKRSWCRGFVQSLCRHCVERTPTMALLAHLKRQVL